MWGFQGYGTWKQHFAAHFADDVLTARKWAVSQLELLVARRALEGPNGQRVLEVLDARGARADEIEEAHEQQRRMRV